MRKKINKFLSVFLCSILLFFSVNTSHVSQALTELTTLSIDGEEIYDEAYKILDILNQEREANGLNSLEINETLMKAAMNRSGEISMYFSHTRPNDTKWYTMDEIQAVDYRKAGENIAAGYNDAESVMDAWMNSTSHRENILEPRYNSVGIGVFRQNERIYYTQIFSDVESTTPERPNNRIATKYIEITDDKIVLDIYTNRLYLESGNREGLTLLNESTEFIKLNNYNVEWSSSDENIATVTQDGIVTAKHPGECTIKVTLTTGKSVTCPVYVSGEYVELPGKVQNMHINSNSWSNIYVDWNTVSDVDGYEVYRSRTEDGEYTKIASCTASSYNDTNNGEDLLSASTYYYKVRAYKSINDKTYYGDFSDVLTATTCPLKVRNLEQQSAAWSNITLSWDSSNRATGYKIYRSTTKDGTYTQVGDTTSTSFNDNNAGNNLLSASTYYYKVRGYKTLNGVDYHGNYSDVLAAATAPLKVANLHTESRTRSTIALDWDYSNRASGYAIYRSTTKDGTYSRVGTSTSSKYTDTKLKSGTTYYYKVRAFKTQDGVNHYGTYSNILYTYTSK